MNQRNTLAVGAIMGGLAVAFGAFGAHALKGLLTQNGRVETYELAVRYQIYHALALLLIGLLMDKFQAPGMKLSGVSMLIGILFFSGSLYAFALTNITSYALITPFGGLFFLMGWGLLIAGVLKK